MKFRLLMTTICVLATANLAAAAPFAYVANSGTKNLSVIDTATDTVQGSPITLPDGYAYSVTVGASGQYAYVGIQDTNTVAVIDTYRKVMVKQIGLGTDTPGGLAVNAAETRLYVASKMSNTLLVIDISSGAAELARVQVDDATISNPEGVVLSAAGDKAYVANSSTGKIAEVSIDEATNSYVRTSLTSVGGQPMGLALSSTGSKLYIANLTGASVAVMDTATKAVTALPVGTGTVTVAITPDNSKVYAPSNSLDKLYVIDAAATPNVVLGTQYDVAAGPYGSSVTPDGAKLYLTMNTVSAGETVKVFNTASNAVTATINLPAGAKPTSMGDFIGPVFTNTITATNGSGCTILPLGAVPVNSYGRSFLVSQPATPCEVKVDGVSVGQPSSYSFTNVTADHTIDASALAAGTYYTLSGDWVSIWPAACVGSTPAGINCSSKSAKILSGTPVTLKATTGYQVRTGTWGGACAGQGATCTFTMDGDKSFGTTVQFDVSLGGPVFNVTKGEYYQSFAEAFAAAANGNTIKISTDISAGTTDGTAGVIVTVSNQWTKDDYNVKGTYAPMALTITNVGVIADGLTL